MRTTDEIIARIESRQLEDPLGFEWPFYVQALPYDRAKAFLAPFGDDGKIVTDAEVRAQCIEYMPFAWEKANNFRGISASRSISHYQAWLWLLGEDWADSLHDSYEFYGKPQLVRICEYLKLDPNQWDDGIRSNEES